jgi:Dehydrogenases with different specificities (related to short-chain alcohol dehydrogenases)
MDLGLQGKTALVTGSTGGIGLSIATSFGGAPRKRLT